MPFLRYIKLVMPDVHLAAMHREVFQRDYWHLNTWRQDNVKPQKDTESIILRHAKRPEAQSVAGLTQSEVGEMLETQPSPLAPYFPRTLEFLDDAAGKLEGRLERAFYARLKPWGHVPRHIDGGSYHFLRDRYHLVVYSTEGSKLCVADEEVLMRQGELWWFDNKQLHEASNPSDEWRVHLIFDILPYKHAKLEATATASATENSL